MANVNELNDSDFEQSVVKSDCPVVVDFWATWCGPCKTIAPIISELASEYTEKIKFYKMDVDQNPKVPSQFGIKGIPTVILFKNGQVIDQVVGAAGKDTFKKLLEKGN